MQKKEVRHMIYTVTFNPCLDYIVGVEDFQLGMTNRTCSEQMFAGGKGINVSIVLKNLGIEYGTWIYRRFHRRGDPQKSREDGHYIRIYPA